MIYQPGKYLRVYYEGFGNINYQVPDISPTTLTAAADGLSVEAATPHIARLGQTVGQAGDPAALTEDREIPNPGGFIVYFGRNNGLDNVVSIDSNNGLGIANDTGTWLTFFSQNINPPHTVGFVMSTLDGQDISMDYSNGAGTDLIHYNAAPGHLRRFETTRPLVAQRGFGTGFTNLSSAINPAYSIVDTDCVILVDTTGGNEAIAADPVLLANLRIDIKKKSADINTITITPTAGTIQDIGAPAASFVFNVQGQSVTLFSDGINFYIL